jgi:cytoskeletal protein RodZ
MNLAEIQSFRQIGRRLRNAREPLGLTLPAIAGFCGLAIFELVRIENGELLGFKQVPENTLSNTEVYAKALDVELSNVERQHSGVTTINAKNDEVFIPKQALQVIEWVILEHFRGLATCK